MQELSFEPPCPDRFDQAYGLIRALLAAIPFVGGSITELLSTFYYPPFSKRRDEWFKLLAIAMVELQQRDPSLTLQALQEDERFVSAVFSATSIALRTHRQEKLAALANAVKSSVMLPCIEEDEQAIFMAYIDVLTPWHFRVLNCFHDPNGHFAAMGIAERWLVEDGNVARSTSKSTNDLMMRAFPTLAGEWQFLNQLVHDLGQRSLVATSGMQALLPDIGPYTTITGRKFISFIRAHSTDTTNA